MGSWDFELKYVASREKLATYFKLCLQRISIQNPKNPFIYLYIFKFISYYLFIGLNKKKTYETPNYNNFEIIRLILIKLKISWFNF